MFMEYKQTFPSLSARMTQPARMTRSDGVGQAGHGIVSREELEIADYEPRTK